MKRVLFCTFALLVSLVAMAQLSSQRPQYVAFQVTPSAATVTIGDESVATDSGGAAIFTLPNGTYNYSVSAENHRTATGTVVVQGEKVVKKVELVPIYGWLTVASSNLPNGAKVYVDDTLVGQVPIVQHKLPSGTHTVRIEHECYNVFEQRVTICDDQTMELKPTLTPRIGVLNVTSTPPFADVYVDEKLVGQTPLMLDVIIGEHIVKVRKNGVKAVSRRVSVSEGGVAEMNEVLKGPYYEIGDIITINGVKGVVFQVTEDGGHGKAVSVECSSESLQWSSDANEQERRIGAYDGQNGANNMAKVTQIPTNWRNKYPAFKWCADLGESWYLPAKDELLAIYKAKELVNKALHSLGTDGLEGYYWSSTEYEFCAWLVFMYGGRTYYNRKYRDRYVRAVSAF